MTMTGTIKRIVMDRGFGFVKESQSGHEYFFHRSAVAGTFEELREGLSVRFEEEASTKGLRAKNIETA